MRSVARVACPRSPEWFWVSGYLHLLPVWELFLVMEIADKGAGRRGAIGLWGPADVIASKAKCWPLPRCRHLVGAQRVAWRLGGVGVPPPSPSVTVKLGVQGGSSEGMGAVREVPGLGVLMAVLHLMALGGHWTPCRGLQSQEMPCTVAGNHLCTTEHPSPGRTGRLFLLNPTAMLSLAGRVRVRVGV